MKRVDFSLRDLKAVNDLLVESPFDLSAARYVPLEAAWEGFFLLDSKERTCTRRSFFFSEYTALFMPCKLRIEGIKSCRTNDSSRIMFYSLESLSVKDNSLQMTFIENMNISFMLTESSTLRVEYPETPSYSAKFRYYNWIGIESGPFDIEPVLHS